MAELQQHALRTLLHDEVHLRPGLPVPCPSYLSTLTLIDGGSSAQRQHLAHLISELDLPAMAADAVHYRAQTHKFTLRWSLHGEFARITVLCDGEANDFAQTALQHLPHAWLQALPGRLLFAAHALVLPADAITDSLTEAAHKWFAGNALIGSKIAHGQAIAVSDLRLHDDAFLGSGAARVLLSNHSLGKRQCGRLLQDWFEMETYRLLALLSFPIAKKLLPLVDKLEATLQTVTTAIANGGDADALQHDISEAAALLEDAIATSHARFSATRAYANLMQKRVQGLNEQAFDTFPSFGEFMDRRMAPALATVESVRTRLQELSGNIQRTSSLLRNRIELSLLKQNQGLLAALNQRAAAQLRLQETVEALSVAVLGYYTIGLLHYLLEALEKLGVNVHADIVTGLSVPVVIVVLLLSLKRLRKKLLSQSV